jgi:outer membrane immunogenic protein
MRVFGLVFTVLFFVLPLQPAHASLDAIMARLDALEQENAALKRRIVALEKQAASSPPIASAASSAPSGPAAPATAAAARLEAIASGHAAIFPAEASDRWSRTYVGLQGGITIGEPEYPLLGAPFEGATVSGEMEGGGFGLQIGQSWQYGPFVAGVELQARKENIDSETESLSRYTVVNLPDVYDYTGAMVASLDVDWSAAAKGKFGVATESALLYGTLGVTAADVAETYESITIETDRTTGISTVVAGASASTSSIQIGLIAGFGFEYALTEHLSIGAEYEYTRLGDRSFTPVGADAMLDWHTASARLNLSF